MAGVTAVTTVFPDTGLPQIPTQSKISDNELKTNYVSHWDLPWLIKVMRGGVCGGRFIFVGFFWGGVGTAQFRPSKHSFG